MSNEMIKQIVLKAIEEVKTIEHISDARIEHNLGILHMLDAVIYGQPRHELILLNQELRLQIQCATDRTGRTFDVR
jgi:hypothetical protein